MIELILLGLALNLSDDEAQEIAGAIQKGDHKAFKAFFDAHHAKLYRFLISKKLREEVAEDIVQQAFVWIWEHRSEIDASKSLRSYLFKIGYSRMLNYFRDTKKMSAMEENPIELSDGKASDAELMNLELKQAIQKAIEAMPEKRKAVFELCYLQELSYKEAAEVLESSVKTIENHMGLALKQLRESLSYLVK